MSDDLLELVERGGAAVEYRARLAAEREEGRKDALVPSRRDARGKGLRLLVEGRLRVLRVDDQQGPRPGLVVARCAGDSGAEYALGRDPGSGEWRCTCPELRGHCSHLWALKTVTLATDGAR